MSLNTTQLLNKLSSTTDIKAFISEYEHEFRNITWQEFLSDIISEKKISPYTTSRK